ncbi:Zinc finger 19 [Gossypium australe]|uniref:Zinc finger 19 n=1 Tax=Gossypium australe TaxID=47621 RepID=A0A5B6WBU0_9ROSI|nr:Zinc finger 19 [Gossypium australe]
MEFSPGSTMNFHSGRKDAQKHAVDKSCIYCNKVFDDYLALSGHLRIHEEETLRALNFPGHSSNSINITRNPPAPLPNSQLSLASVNNLTPITRAPTLIDFCAMFGSCDANQANRSKSTGGNLGDAQTQIVMSPSGAAFHHNSSASKTFAPVGANAALSSAACASSGGIVATGLPTDSSSFLRKYEVSQDGLPPASRDAMQKTQGYNLGKLPNPTFAITNPDLGCESYQLPRSNGSKVGQSETILLMGEGSKRPCLADNPMAASLMNASKKPKIAPNALEEPNKLQIKELPLLKKLEDSLSALETCVGAEEEGPF